MSGQVHYLSSDTVHYTWDVKHPPQAEVDSGDVIIVQTRDVSDAQVQPSSTTAVIEGMNWDRVYPLSGPVAIRGAEPGDTLQIEVLDLHTLGWGWTWIYPGLGLLPDDFTEPYLRVFEFPDGTSVPFREDIVVPVDPFLGTMGVCPRDADAVNVMPPGPFGGNMDIRQLTRGSTLHLPVQVKGALFSCGDGHAAQGDGELCVAAIEAPLYAALRLSVHKGRSIPSPQFHTPHSGTRLVEVGGFYATTGVGGDLFVAAQEAVRAMIDYLGDRYALHRQDAYMLCSLAVDLKISEIVDAGQYIVSAFLPLALFQESPHGATSSS